MTLQERIAEAIERITSGRGLMRIPPAETDPDVVLSDCAKELANLALERDLAQSCHRAASEGLGAAQRERAEAIEALGPAWLVGGVSLAEGIKRKTERLESVAVFAPIDMDPRCLR